ncbi:hypothetical protein OAS39_12795 [Pirellulales bacterium]|nr:hypothetical protein [Pirellulales bacterium]
MADQQGLNDRNPRAVQKSADEDEGLASLESPGQYTINDQLGEDIIRDIRQRVRLFWQAAGTPDAGQIFGELIARYDNDVCSNTVRAILQEEKARSLK